MADLWLNSYRCVDEGFNKAVCLHLCWCEESKLQRTADGRERPTWCLSLVYFHFFIFNGWICMKTLMGGHCCSYPGNLTLRISWPAGFQWQTKFNYWHGRCLPAIYAALLKKILWWFYAQRFVFRTLQKRDGGLWQYFLHLIFTVNITLLAAGWLCYLVQYIHRSAYTSHEKNMRMKPRKHIWDWNYGGSAGHKAAMPKQKKFLP